MLESPAGYKSGIQLRLGFWNFAKLQSPRPRTRNLRKSENAISQAWIFHGARPEPYPEIHLRRPNLQKPNFWHRGEFWGFWPAARDCSSAAKAKVRNRKREEFCHLAPESLVRLKGRNLIPGPTCDFSLISGGESTATVFAQKLQKVAQCFRIHKFLIFCALCRIVQILDFGFASVRFCEKCEFASRWNSSA